MSDPDDDVDAIFYAMIFIPLLALMLL